MKGRWRLFSALFKRGPMRDGIQLFLATRLLLITITYISYILLTVPKYSSIPIDLIPLLSSWDRKEVAYYLHIAQYGYQTKDDFIFFPLFPLLIAAISHMLGDWSYLLVGTIINNAAFLGALLLLSRLIADEIVVQRMLLYLCLFPTAFSFFIADNTGLYLLLVVGTFSALKQQKWGLAGLLPSLATLTRLDGFLLFIPYFYELWAKKAFKRLPLAIFLFLGAISVYPLFCWLTTGDPFIFLATSGPSALIWPGLGIGQALLDLFSTPFASYRQLYLFLNLGAILTAIILTIIGWRKIRPSWLIWQCCFLIFILSKSLVSIEGNSLFAFQYSILMLFPVFMMLASLGQRYPRLNEALLLILPTLQALLAITFL